MADYRRGTRWYSPKMCRVDYEINFASFYEDVKLQRKSFTQNCFIMKKTIAQGLAWNWTTNWAERLYTRQWVHQPGGVQQTSVI